MLLLYLAERSVTMRLGSAAVAVLLLGACLAVLADDTTKVAPQAIPEAAAETSKCEN